MIAGAAARPYSRALFDAAHDHEATAAVAKEIGQVLEIWNGSEQLRNFFSRPEVPLAAKESVSRKVFADVGSLVQRTIQLLLEKHRIQQLPSVYHEFMQLWDRERGIIHAQVEVAVPLSEQEESSLNQAIHKATGRRVALDVRHNPTLLGGLVVRIGDRVLDGSLARRLAILGDRLRSADRGGNTVEY